MSLDFKKRQSPGQPGERMKFALAKWWAIVEPARNGRLSFDPDRCKKLTTVCDDLAEAAGPIGSYPVQTVLGANGQREKAPS